MTTRDDQIEDGQYIGRIYGLFDSRQPIFLWNVRYIGLTVKKPQVRHGGHLSRAKKGEGGHKNAWIRSVLAGGGSIVMHVLEVHVNPDREQLLETLLARECAWIAAGHNQQWALTNGTDGGEGVIGYTHSEETRAKIAATSKGRIQSEETRAKRSASLKGKTRDAPSPLRGTKKSAEARENMRVAQQNRPPMSDETKAKLSAANAGRKASDETRAKISAGMMGRTVTQETRDKIGNANRGRVLSPEEAERRRANPPTLGMKFGPHTEESKAKMSAAKMGHPVSQETRDKIGAANRAAAAKKRAAKESESSGPA